jgi:hypothetical protein
MDSDSDSDDDRDGLDGIDDRNHERYSDSDASSVNVDGVNYDFTVFLSAPTVRFENLEQNKLYLCFHSINGEFITYKIEIIKYVENTWKVIIYYDYFKGISSYEKFKKRR